MNISMLSLDEVLRIYEPTTELERTLFSFLSDGKFVEVSEYECPDCNDFERDIENYSVTISGASDLVCDIREAVRDDGDKEEVLDMIQELLVYLNE